MAFTITKGYTFGATELVTNTKLHSLVDDATLDASSPGAIGGTTPAAGAFTTLGASGLFTLTSGQIKFPATQSASADANTLDDYEEGTATVAMACATGSITINTSYRTVYYTKIGNVVHLYGYLSVTSVSSPTGAWRVTGIPFQSGANNYSSGGIYPNGMEATATSQMCLYIGPASTEMYIGRFATGVMAGAAPDAKAGANFGFYISYNV